MPSINEILEQERIEQATEAGIEVAIFELVDKQDSTWIRQGTENLPEPQRKNSPGARQILNKSAYAVFKKKGANSGEYDRIETRHIYGCDNIEVKKQATDSTALPNADLDRIVFVDGRIIVANEGATKSRFKFMRMDSRNVTCNCRIPGSEDVYREIFPELEKENFNEDEFLVSDALRDYIQPLVEKKNGKFEYNEKKLQAYCRLFGVHADSPGAKIETLIQLAKYKPAMFIEKAKIFEESVFQEISAALTLGLIQFEPTMVTYVGKDDVITTYSSKLSQDQKIAHLADFFRSDAGVGKYQTFVANLEFEKKKIVNNN